MFVCRHHLQVCAPCMSCAGCLDLERAAILFRMLCCPPLAFPLSSHGHPRAIHGRPVAIPLLSHCRPMAIPSRSACRTIAIPVSSHRHVIAIQLTCECQPIAILYGRRLATGERMSMRVMRWQQHGNDMARARGGAHQTPNRFHMGRKVSRVFAARFNSHASGE